LAELSKVASRGGAQPAGRKLLGAKVTLDFDCDGDLSNMVKEYNMPKTKKVTQQGKHKSSGSLKQKAIKASSNAKAASHIRLPDQRGGTRGGNSEADVVALEGSNQQNFLQEEDSAQAGWCKPKDAACKAKEKQKKLISGIRAKAKAKIFRQKAERRTKQNWKNAESKRLAKMKMKCKGPGCHPCSLSVCHPLSCAVLGALGCKGNGKGSYAPSLCIKGVGCVVALYNALDHDAVDHAYEKVALRNAPTGRGRRLLGRGRKRRFGRHRRHRGSKAKVVKTSWNAPRITALGASGYGTYPQVNSLFRSKSKKCYAKLDFKRVTTKVPNQLCQRYIRGAFQPICAASTMDITAHIIEASLCNSETRKCVFKKALLSCYKWSLLEGHSSCNEKETFGVVQ